MITVTVTVHGRLFTGAAAGEIRRGLDDAVRDVADRGMVEVRRRLGGVLRHPTGRYSSSIRVERAHTDRAITDGGIVYGPWLEGVSRRNQTTRFKGYQTFRRTTGQLQRDAVPIADRHIGRAVSRLNS